MLSNIIEKIFKPKKSNFNEEALNHIWPPKGTGFPFTEFGKELLQKCTMVQKPDANEVDIANFIEQSLRFPVKVRVTPTNKYIAFYSVRA